jgi:hypothetical protein
MPSFKIKTTFRHEHINVVSAESEEEAKQAAHELACDSVASEVIWEDSEILDHNSEEEPENEVQKKARQKIVKRVRAKYFGKNKS